MKYVLDSKSGGAYGVSVYLERLTPIFRSDSAQEWGEDITRARKFPSSKAAREFAAKWHIDAELKAIQA